MSPQRKKSSNRKRSSAKDDGNLEPPPKIFRKSQGSSNVQPSVIGSPVSLNGGVLQRKAKPISPTVSDAELSIDETSVLSTPSSMNAKAKTAMVTPPKSPPQSTNEHAEIVVERMELSSDSAQRLDDKIDDLITQSSCEIKLNTEADGSAVVTFRGSQKAIKTTRAMVSVICSQIEKDKSSSFVDKAVASVNEFFHAQTGPQGCLLGGWLRIGYAFLFIMDRLLWSLELSHFFYQSGVLPTKVAQSYSYIEPDNMLSIFQLAPESDWLIWAVNYLCLLQGILLLVGVAPRFQLVCLVLYLASWEHHNDHVWDSQDVMLRFFGFLLCFLPLHRLTIFEWWQTRGMSKEGRKSLIENDSWPMWPFRLWQIEVCLIYAGAGLSKLSYSDWWEGHAVYYATFSNHFGGIFTPDFLFNRILPLKLACWGSLFIECVSIVTIWPLATRMPTLVAIILLHVGIDLSMNMNIFEWLSILGWMVFLVRPDKSRSDSAVEGSNADDKQDEDELVVKSTSLTTKRCNRRIINMFIVAFIFIYGCETFPFYHVKRLIPDALKPAITFVQKGKEQVLEITEPWLHRLGIHQATWSMFSKPVRKSERYEAYITFTDGSKTKWWSPDWQSMSWLELKRNRRRQLYFNNLMEFKHEDDVGQKHFCEWLSNQYDKKVERVKLVYHKWDAPEPNPNLGWFDPALPSMDEMKKRKETHYIYYAAESCTKWAEEGDCLAEPTFMLKRCPEQCEKEVDTVDDLKIGSHVVVFSDEDDSFYAAKVLEIRDKKPQHRVKWDFPEFGKEWLDLNETAFFFVGEEKASRIKRMKF